jgi:hypothetical protein
VIRFDLLYDDANLTPGLASRPPNSIEPIVLCVSIFNHYSLWHPGSFEVLGAASMGRHSSETRTTSQLLISMIYPRSATR